LQIKEPQFFLGQIKFSQKDQEYSFRHGIFLKNCYCKCELAQPWFLTQEFDLARINARREEYAEWGQNVNATKNYSFFFLK
jgi:hypothetical protein